MLFQPVNLELETLVGINKFPGRKFLCPKNVLRLRPMDCPPDRAFMKFGAEEFRRKASELRAHKRSHAFHLCVNEPA
jgi:hypothetical protein